MKSIIFLILLTTFSVLNTGMNQTNNSILDNLLKDRRYFEFRKAFELRTNDLSESGKQYYFALMECIFNKPRSSNKRIDYLLQNNNSELTDSMKVILLKSKIVNCVNLFDYKEANEGSNRLVNNYKSLIEPDEIEETINSTLIWDACKNLEKQTIEKSGDSKLPVKRDIAGLVNIEVNVNDVSEHFIFDTGANFSTISESTAGKMNLIFLENKIKVGSFTGSKVDSRLAYAANMKIGNMNVKNVLFLVMPDEALTFGGGIYVINGIIGFPVIKEMQEIHLTSNEIFIPVKAGESGFVNLGFDGFTPVIETLVNSDTLVFTFDTGAKHTTLYYEYYRKNKTVIDSMYEPVEIKTGGAGGEVKIPGFNLKDVKFEISSKEKIIDKVSLFSKIIKDNDKYLHGNLGSDFINSFSKMKINFIRMFVEFEN